ncbi:molybdenum ABC transporter ATP-binding protein [Roseospira marina]|uniref:Molybdenum ABC transporter ATP-binding protein n=1 Tax=Roseospira marina TaxID=140057 RepID=A0A5M6IC18_9PROT|nr:molybdenum ABC transporter ATP-binding protein [Roseospira marina]KAA5605796.1 molybdenum ABC transporter ATP-binding protein [Roseospira marina]MBB4313610.1 molybdate transport system ATP-binding protein [Roseospira marina]MBB5086772.1 molybdate transport system ATP-binding protein [Roseospira marina]
MTPRPDRITAGFTGRLGTFDLNARFEVPATGVTALFGPSGCGKTTVLRCMAGLTRLNDGVLRIGADVWQDGARFVPPHRRPIGYVFQEASLFPHLSVPNNLRYGQRRTRNGARPVAFDDVVDLLGLARLLDRPTAVLSGGERQRVAIGRALLSQPRLLLMDEPLSALDRFSKDEILPYLETLHDRLDIPVLYVSHDIAEVERLADTLVLMDHGRAEAVGPLSALMADPALPLARLPEAAEVLDAEVVEHDSAYGLATVAVPGGRLIVPADAGAVGTRHRLRIVANDVSLSRQPPAAADSSILNVLPVRIIGAEPTGAHLVTVFLLLGHDGTGAPLLARITRKSWDMLGLAAGQTVHAMVKGVALVDRPAPEPPTTHTGDSR